MEILLPSTCCKVVIIVPFSQSVRVWQNHSCEFVGKKKRKEKSLCAFALCLWWIWGRFCAVTMGHSLNWDAFLGFVERMGFCQWQWTATPCHAMLFLSAMEATLGLEDWIPASTASHGRRAGDSEVMPKRKKLVI
ncbi:hypothetical protein MPTK1_2g09850 [Marchantia polymorpha subsp. ruderalis]|uniref:Uncharacterized protein n=1 Tax=Marchantia polymorpha TaxID=3197 RepID=A0A2R6W8C2_MARPO|nr:hypothetical protein MARPO_0129s0011 [Marchantia polymorpha]BBN01726.1 hypothetical protein Mp_2g09850 [Marchantia polymorpha subsp. ruderalis]PTQ30111.1 hypothetical protein MARPO_0129s0011 [Marchantia polymorpha]PTQ30112.1 hypothetical protein MARPO_0129s0011 [Marchantia polymorpha]PTQ30113.1 hypothetical protein MARPO_0129s0011 [Marchantia polymorpha]|eukprot:PTQ30110.1 hypothetical protein MARPO_0129s0011 [Marchantia polymorpha]